MDRTPLLACAACITAALSSAHAQLQITIDPAARHQTIEGFGVMATGTWDLQVRDLYQQPAYATQLRDDLGISMLRIEVPPTLQPNEDLQPGTLDWSRFDLTAFGAGGALAANLNLGHPGAVKIVGSIWSPPWWMKTNNSEIEGGHLRTDRYPHFAKFCAGACLGFQNSYGLRLEALSIQNEPVFAEPYTSCVYTPVEYRDAVLALNSAFYTWQVPSRLFGSEDVGTVPSRWMSFVTTIAGSPAALARMDAWAIHHYPWENGVDYTSPAAWASLRQQVQPYSKPMWVSEVSGEEPDWLGNAGNPKGALTLANQIHDALVYGEATAYIYWQSSGSGPVDRFTLMQMTQPSKKYFACKQYFRFIRPGAVRIGTSPDSGNTLVSAYLRDATGALTVVLINRGSTPSPVRLNLAGPSGVLRFDTTRTSQTEDTVALPTTPVVSGHADLTLPAYSVVTLSSSCYANCDGSSAAPVLNVADFTCFLQQFAAANPYANCDGSTAAPVLNVADFTCFLQRFAAGCAQ